ncbi:MAG: RodZ domain-containing protein [Gammaproteobacteria bacterium]
MESEPARTLAPTDGEIVALQPAGAGETLKSARTRLGMSLEHVAKLLCLPTQIVVALEDEDHEALPAPVYVKGYLRAYARALEIDERKIIEKYQALGVREHELRVADAVNEGPPNSISVGLSAGAVALVSVALSALWWGTEQREIAKEASIDQAALAASESRPLTRAGTRDGSALQRPRQIERDPAQAGGNRAADENRIAGSSITGQHQNRAIARNNKLPGDRQVTDGRGAALPRESDAASLEAPAARLNPDAGSRGNAAIADSANARAPESAETVAGAATRDDSPVPPDDDAGSRAAAAHDQFALRYRDDSWTEVTDASGKQLMYGTVSAGEARSVAGEAPFEVLLGRASSVQVTINDEAFDSSPFVRTNETARFTVDTRAGQ